MQKGDKVIYKSENKEMIAIFLDHYFGPRFSMIKLDGNIRIIMTEHLYPIKDKGDLNNSS